MATLPTSTTEKSYRSLTALLVILITFRVLLMVLVPHMDSSEARFAEISRKMVETGDWITPQLDYGIPLRAYPPLSMWMSALGIDLFGVNEFGSRVFIFLSSMGVLALVARAVRRETDAFTALAAATLLMAMPLFFYCSAAVMTDLALVLGTTMAMAGFRIALMENSRPWGYVFFAGLAVGLLTKGPLALALVLPPVMGWISLTKNWKLAGRSIPWFTGILLMLALAMPWYLIAEKKIPGFSDYFFVGEHWRRFMQKGWQGDLTGKVHLQAPGMVWLYLPLLIFPWFLGFLAIPFRKWKQGKSWALAEQGRGLYWLLWAVWPLVLFTPSRDIAATCLLPSLPAVAILLAALVHRSSNRGFPRKRFHPLHPALIAACLVGLFITGIVFILMPDLAPHHTERALVEYFHKERGAEDRLLYFGLRRASAEFYSEGEAAHTDSPEALIERLNSPGRLFVVMTAHSLEKLPPNIQRRLRPDGATEKKKPSLYVERTDTPRLNGIDPFQTYPIGS
ncbi:MAG: glycosyltransferase family 39 protein [Verrucomicrobiota bacterium]